MESVKKIIKIKNLSEENSHCNIENDGYLPLTIEFIGKDKDGNQLVSVCHYAKQNGDLMRDPEMVFMVREEMVYPSLNARLKGKKPYMKEKWYPVYFRNDFAGFERNLINTGKYMVDGFHKIWDKNIREQGFILKASE